MNATTAIAAGTAAVPRSGTPDSHADTAVTVLGPRLPDRHSDEAGAGPRSGAPDHLPDGTVCHDPSPRQVHDWETDRYYHKLGQKEYFNEKWAIEDLDIARLRETVRWLVRRHDSLRAFFPAIDGRIRLALLSPDADLFDIAVYDLTYQPPEEIETVSYGLFLENLAEVCKLEQGPLFRVYVIKREPNISLVNFCIHHIISDAWSVAILRRELSDYYRGLMAGGISDPAVSAPSMLDYCHDKNRRQHRDEMDLHRKYWKDQLRVFDGSRAVPMWNRVMAATTGMKTGDENYDQLWKRISGSPARCCQTAIESPLIDRLQSLALRYRISLRNVVSLGLYQAYSKCFGINQLLFASPVADRFNPKYKNFVGNLTGGIYLPMDLCPNLPTEKRLHQLNTSFMLACRHLIFHHDDLGLDGVHLRMNCNLFVNFEPSPDKSALLPRIDGIHAAYENSFYALACNIREFANGMTCFWTYKEQIHDGADIDRIAAALKDELENMVG